VYWVYAANSHVNSHVEEGEFTFQDRYWDQRFRGRRPTIAVPPYPGYALAQRTDAAERS
jgi:hypothetical protein